MESARRASEIHRRRCGRSFRITEEAVLNEEMYEEEDPDYGLRVSRLSGLYASLANDNSMIQQQWLNSQRLRFDPSTNTFVMNPFIQDMQNMQNMSPTSPSLQEGLPFFAYQPGAQPSSTPIRSGQSEDYSTKTSNDVSLGPTANGNNHQGQALGFFQLSQSETGQSPQPMSPQSVAPQNQGKQPMSPNMFDGNPNPMSAHLNLFTYPTPDFSTFNMGNYLHNMMTQNPTSGTMDQGPMSPRQTTTLSGFPSTPQITNAQFSNLLDNRNESNLDNSGSFFNDDFVTKKHPSYLYSPAIPDETTLLDMQTKLMSHPPNDSPDHGSTLKLEDGAEPSYDDWLCIPNSSQN
jgi:hypothetical protein